eukprot:355011-Chlamydomonas_euryale.AAC.1
MGHRKHVTCCLLSWFALRCTSSCEEGAAACPQRKPTSLPSRLIAPLALRSSTRTRMRGRRTASSRPASRACVKSRSISTTTTSGACCCWCTTPSRPSWRGARSRGGAPTWCCRSKTPPATWRLSREKAATWSSRCGDIGGERVWKEALGGMPVA